jgi:hypothetical protein
MTDAQQRLSSYSATPFARLALAQTIGVAGDVFLTVALADSLFFAAATAEARPKVLLYLLITMAPFAVVAPVIGPALDRTRGGRRVMMAAALGIRAVLCFVMANHIDGLALYPLAFTALVASKAQGIAKSSLVPALIEDRRELVLANSRLSLISILAGAVAALPAAVILKGAGGEWVLRTAALILATGPFFALAIPKAEQVAPAETVHDREVLHAPSIVVAGTAMAALRGVVGFMTFFAAFVLKREHEPAWMFGLVIVASAIGNGLGTLIAPPLRKRVREEWILAGALLAPVPPLILAARSYGRPALAIAAFLVAASASVGRLAFDSLLQRDAAEAARGRAFARFETRFQLVWVAGGAIAVVVPFAGRAGLFLIALVLMFVGLSYLGAARRPDAAASAAEARRARVYARVRASWRAARDRRRAARDQSIPPPQPRGPISARDPRISAPAAAAEPQVPSSTSRGSDDPPADRGEQPRAFPAG